MSRFTLQFEIYPLHLKWLSEQNKNEMKICINDFEIGEYIVTDYNPCKRHTVVTKTYAHGSFLSIGAICFFWLFSFTNIIQGYFAVEPLWKIWATESYESAKSNNVTPKIKAQYNHMDICWDVLYHTTTDLIWWLHMLNYLNIGQYLSSVIITQNINSPDVR